MKAGQGQTLIDVAAQMCGNAEMAWDIAVRSGFALTETPGDGELEIPAEGGDPDTATEMASTGARPATDCTVTAEQVVAIGQFRIGRDRIR